MFRTASDPCLGQICIISFALFRTGRFKNHTLSSGTSLCELHEGVIPGNCFKQPGNQLIAANVCLANQQKQCMFSHSGLSNLPFLREIKKKCPTVFVSQPQFRNLALQVIIHIINDIEIATPSNIIWPLEILSQ